MLNAIVNSAYTWMSNGLNINKFKLVLYMSSEKMVSLFKELKRKLNRCKYSRDSKASALRVCVPLDCRVCLLIGTAPIK